VSISARPFVSRPRSNTRSIRSAEALRHKQPEEKNEMKVNSISGITCYVRDLSKTAEFYEAIGFRRGKEEPDRITFYVNWFFVTFIAQDREADAELGVSRCESS
jgi:hypothetical protein